MSDSTELEDLKPLSKDEWTMGLLHYIPVWWSSLIIVQAFVVAFFAVYPHGILPLLQAGIVIGIGSLIVTVRYIVSEFPRYEKGIQFAVQI